ncbi:hypothetical protein QEN19_001292 [Hanseniaspora menglaensis]
MTKSILPTSLNNLKYLKAEDLYKCILNEHKTIAGIKGYSLYNVDSTLDIDANEPIVVVDVRGEDFIGGHIKGCVNFPYQDFRRVNPDTGIHDQIDSFIKKYLEQNENVTIVFHCAMSQQRGPSAALLLSRILQETKYQQLLEKSNINIMVLYKGFINWQQEYGKDKAVTEDYNSFVWG